MSLIKTYLHTLQMNNQLEMLSQREQLMEDIDSICDDFFYANDHVFKNLTFEDDSSVVENFTMQLCDAVCKNFPTN